MPYKPAKIVLQSSPNIERSSLQNRRLSVKYETSTDRGEAYSGTLSRPKSPKVALSRLKSPKVALSRLKSPKVALSRLCRAML